MNADPAAPAIVGPPIALSASSDFDDLYREHYPRLTRALALAGAGPAAEDLAQEAMARTLARWRRVRAGSNPAGYAYTVGFRLLQRQRRRESRSSTTFDDGRAASVPGPEGLAVTALVVARALDEMPPGRRAVAALCISLGWTTDEAASVLHIAPSTARVQLHRARTDLHRALGEPEPPE